MQNKLLPCPFCGGEAFVDTHKFWDEKVKDFTVQTYCVACHQCSSKSWQHFRTEEEAIKAWNTRKPMERIVEQLENHKNCYEKVIGQVIVDNYDINLERVDLMNHAIDIVRKGGVDNAE